MKNTLTLFLLLFISIFSKAQLAPIGTKWTYSYLSLGSNGPEQGKAEYIISKDTTINNVVYSKIISDRHEKDIIYMTEDSNQIYYLYKNQKLLFFDFNANVGDTLLLDVLFYSPDSLLKKSPVIVYEKFYMKNDANDTLISYRIKGNFYDYNFNQTISQKIFLTSSGRRGVSNNLFQSIVEYSESFKCYEEPTGYNFKLVNDCTKVGVDELSIKKEIELYPNPARDILHINWSYTIKDNTNLCLYNNQAKQLYKGALHKENTIKLNDLNLKAGLYWVLIYDGTSSFYKKVIIE